MQHCRRSRMTLECGGYVNPLLMDVSYLMPACVSHVVMALLVDGVTIALEKRGHVETQ